MKISATSVEVCLQYFNLEISPKILFNPNCNTQLFIKRLLGKDAGDLPTATYSDISSALIQFNLIITSKNH
ncbi:MAG: hypothetical protein ACHBN1_34800 [Heteroscytonema crispum UTEX LB 1556]